MKANNVMVLGEITTNTKVDYVQIVKSTLKTIGYEDEENGTKYVSFPTIISILIQQLIIGHATCLWLFKHKLLTLHIKCMKENQLKMLEQETK